MSDDTSSQNVKKNWIEKIADAFTTDPKDSSEFKDFLSEANSSGVIDDAAFSIMEGALDVSDMHVRDIMVPRSQMTVIQDGDTLEKIFPIIAETAHSRFPIVSSENEVIGVLLSKDLLVLALKARFDLEKMDSQLKEIIRKPVFVPESKRLNTLLRDFKANRNHMALVVDEYGEVAGLVTIEDVLEEIVGEIEDEHDDAEEVMIKKVDSNLFQVNALVEMEEFDEYFDTRLENEEFDTLGGVVTHAFGHLPKRGEEINLDGMNVRVISADGRRIKTLEITAKV